MSSHTYIAIDLKSFYASVECVERRRDPLTTHLVVADPSRTEKTICLAVSPSLKAYGLPGRVRLFEVVQKVRGINAERLLKAPGHRFLGSSDDAGLLAGDPSLSLEYIIAPPRMARYMQISTQIYQIYLRYIAPEDIHVYSIDEVFLDATAYLRTYHLSARDLARKMILDVLQETGITATAGIGTNLYLAKVAMDVEAKHIAPAENGVRIAEASGPTDPLRISGEWAAATRESSRKSGSTPWETSRDARSAGLRTSTMRTFCTACSASMPSF